MNYLTWHYLRAPGRLPAVWKNLWDFIPHFFSLKELASHLFSPWKRVTLEKERGFDPGKWFNTLTFNLVSRVIGALSRLTIIFSGLLAYLWLILAFPAGFLLWFLIPGLTYPLYKSLRTEEERPDQLFSGKPVSPSEIFEKFRQTALGQFFFARLQLPKDFFHPATLLQIEIPDQAKENWPALILFLAERWPPFLQLLKQRGLSTPDVQRVLFWFEDLEKTHRAKSRFWEKENLLRVTPLGRNLIYGYTVNLDRFTTDLTSPMPYSHHLVGRQKEAKMMEQILSRSNNNNLLLIGEPGVGRQTIVLNFARLVSKGRTHPSLSRKRVLELNLNQILAQAKTPAEGKALVETIFNEAVFGGNVILVIKHFDLFVSGGEGRTDLTDVLIKPAASNDLQIIGITTPSDYQKFIFPNAEIKKYFEKVEVTEPTKEEAYQILQRVTPVFEQNTKTFITYSAVKEAIEKSDQYLIDLPFPEKAIDLLDEVAVSVAQNNGFLVTKIEVDQILSQKTKIPVGELAKEEKDKLIKLEEILHRRVIAQDEAVNQIAKAMRRARMGISTKNRPMGTFLFLGPTGVGKTETAKALAFAYFGSDQRMIRFDLSEYQSPDALEKAAGSLSTKEPGLFTKAIRENPFSLLLLDEIEKANPQLLNLFLTILDEGYFTDTFGKKVDCRNLIIIATSNASAEFIRVKVNEKVPAEELTKQVVEEVLKKQVFSPEFLSRFDGVIVFKPLTTENLTAIAKQMLENLNQRLSVQECSVKITPELIKRLVELGYEPAFGARPMRRAIQDKIEDQIAQKLLKGEIEKGEEIEIKI